MPTLPEPHIDACPLTCSCASCKSTLAVYTYKAGAGREGMVHDDKKVKTDDKEMSASCVLCTAVRDRQGDVINPAGVDFTEHSWNPIVLWDHGRAHNLPIGLTESPKGEYTVLYHPEEDVITQKSYFAPDQFSTQIYSLIKDRYIRANSIAVKDLEVEKIPADPEAGHFKAGKYIARSSLAEVTWTPLPANPEAVASLVSAGKIEGGGFAREELHPLILKSLQPFAARRSEWANGYTLKSHTAAGPAPATEKRSHSMPDNLRRKNEELDEPEVTEEEAPAKEMPPGAQFAHNHHDLLAAHKAMLDEERGKQENPAIRDLIEEHKDMLDTMAQRTRDVHSEQYPDHAAPEEEKSVEMEESEPGDRTRPDEVNPSKGRAKPDREPGRSRVDDEEKSARRRSQMSKKAHDFVSDSTLRTFSREQAALMAEQEELFAMEAELEAFDKQQAS